MALRMGIKQDINNRNIVILALLMLAVGALYYQNIVAFSSYYSIQNAEFNPTPGAPLLSAGQDNIQEQQQITDSAGSLPAAAPMLKSAAAPASAPAPRALTTETYTEKNILQDPAIYYGAISILGLMLILNIFKVSFQSSAVFDSDIFKTLSSETRVEMLYALQERRKTLSELASEADISLPGAKQHLQLLESKGLVKKLDEGRKWKYYELTEQGRTIIAERFA